MPETKEQSKQWCRKEDRPPLKAKTVSSSKKVMMTVFWDCDGIILIDYLESGRTINSEYYSNLLRNDLRNALKNKRRGKLSSIPLLQQDNARPHTAARTVDTIRQMGWILLPHPPYSPDLAPSDFHLFSALKKPLRGKHFVDEEDMKRAVTQWVRKTPSVFFLMASDVSRTGGESVCLLKENTLKNTPSMKMNRMTVIMTVRVIVILSDDDE